MAREPLKNKARRPARDKGGAAKAAEEPDVPAPSAAHTPDLVERFPRREGNLIVADRRLTPAEAKARQVEQDMMQTARLYRQRKRAEARALRVPPVEG